MSPYTVVRSNPATVPNRKRILRYTFTTKCQSTHVEFYIYVVVFFVFNDTTLKKSEMCRKQKEENLKSTLHNNQNSGVSFYYLRHSDETLSPIKIFGSDQEPSLFCYGGDIKRVYVETLPSSSHIYETKVEKEIIIYLISLCLKP